MPGRHINPAVTFRLFLARKLSLPRAVFYMICQCLGAICGAGVVKGFMEGEYKLNGGGANSVAHGYTKGDGFRAEILLAPLPIGFAVFLVHLATIPITRTSINPARSLGAAIVYNKSHAWNDQVWERELKTIEECKLGVSAAKRRQQMIGCLPKLFNMIRDIFRLSKCSVLTSQEFVHKIISNDTDVIDRSEVEERLHLLRQLAPEWIS